MINFKILPCLVLNSIEYHQNIYFGLDDPLNSFKHSSLEETGNYCLKDFRFSIGGRRFLTYFESKWKHFETDKRPIPKLTTIQKIISLFRGLILTIPGFLLIGFVFLTQKHMRQIYFDLYQHEIKGPTSAEILIIKIESAIKFFLFHSTRDSSRHTSIQNPSLLDKISDVCLKDLRCRFGKNQNTYYQVTPAVQAFIPWHLSLTYRILNVFKETLLILIGVTLKATALLTHEGFRSNYLKLNLVYQNKKLGAFEECKGFWSLWDYYQLPIQKEEKIISTIFKIPYDRSLSAMELLPMNILLSILSYLSIKKDFSKFALCNKKLYNMTREFFMKKRMSMYPICLQTVLDKKIFEIPFIEPKQNSCCIIKYLLRNSKLSINSLIDEKKIQRIDYERTSYIFIRFISPSKEKKNQVMILTQDRKNNEPWKILKKGLTEDEWLYFSDLFEKKTTLTFEEFSKKQQRFKEICSN